jgi:hypothetical protein
MKVEYVVAIFAGALLTAGLANATELSAASHAPSRTRANPEPPSEMSYDQGALWTSDYGPSYDISRPDDEDPLAGLPIGTGSQLGR